jgi:hypothetical protein
MNHRIFDLYRNCIPAFFRWIACACLLLLTVVAKSNAQQVKEHSSKDEPQYEGAPPPFKHPDVYWHDPDLRLDLDASKEPWRLLVQRNQGEVEKLPLNELDIWRVNAIHRAAPDRAVLMAELTAGAHLVGIIGTNPVKLLDQFWTAGRQALSPNNRYVIFVRFYPLHGADNYDDQYRLYDVLGTRASNWPKRPAGDGSPTEPINYDDTLAGVPIYSLKAGEVDRVNTNVPEGTEHEGGTDFLWSADSSKAVFSDSQAKVITLVLVTVPVGGKGGPITLVHPLIGSENICQDKGECDATNVQSLTWNGDAVNVRVRFHPEHEKDREMNLTIPLSSFVPAPK